MFTAGCQATYTPSLSAHGGPCCFHLQGEGVHVVFDEFQYLLHLHTTDIE